MKKYLFFIITPILAAILFVVWNYGFRPPPEYILDSDTVWKSDSNPRLITNTIIIPSGITLTIDPGSILTEQVAVCR